MTKISRTDVHILVVDDHEDSRGTAIDFLKALNFQHLTVVQDGREALVALEEDPTIGLILSDWDMPTVDGLTLLKKVRANPKWAHLPFIIMSSPRSVEHEKISAAAEDLVDDYIVKPFRLTTLEEKLEKTLSHSVHGPQKIVVLADDEADSRDMVADYLIRFGFKRVQIFKDGEAAFTFISQNASEIGMIIADWEMPKLRGGELLGLCKRTKSLSDIPFFIITSQVSVERAKVMHAAHLDVDQYLLKPFGSMELKERIDRVLNKKRVEREVGELSEKGFDELERGHSKAALLKFQKALKLNPDFDMGISGMGDAILRTKTVDAAIPYYQKALAINPSSEMHYIKLAKAYEQKDEFGKAVHILSGAKNNLPPSTEILMELARLYIGKEMFRKALEELTEAKRIDPGHPGVGALILEAKRGIEGK